MNIADLITEDKQATFQFGETTFEVRLRLLNKSHVERITKSSTVPKYNRELKAHVDEIDPEKYNRAVAAEAIVGWDGLTMALLSTLVPINEEAIEHPEDEFEFSVTNAESLIMHSVEFSSWLVERVSDLDSFRRLSK